MFRTLDKCAKHLTEFGALVLSLLTKPLCGAKPQITYLSSVDRYSQRFTGVVRREKEIGAEGDRTPNLSIANAALSQLSYGPSQGGL